jgi:type II secretory pathway component PulK
MKLLQSGHRSSHTGTDERGAALLLAFLVLIVIIAITYQIHTVTKTDARVAHNELTRVLMDLAIESTMLQVIEDLAEDARAAQASEGEGEGEGAAGAPGGAGGVPGEGGTAPGTGTSGTSGSAPGEPASNPDSVDSQMDGWYTPASTNFDDIQVRLFIRDEDSKFNVLNMLLADEELAEESFDIVVRILDNCREGTDYDIGPSDAQELARAMQEHLRERDTSSLPRPALLSDVEEPRQQGLPLTFREFRGLEPFNDDHFYEGYDEDGNRVHGIDAFLTVFTSPAMGEEVPGATTATGGFGVNVNTAPRAVLDALVDRRYVSGQLWEAIVEYRNEAEEPDPNAEQEDVEPMLDEFGQEITPKKIFDGLAELEEVFDFKSLLAEEKTKVNQRLAVQSHVFEIILTARLPTQREEDRIFEFRSRKEQEDYFRSGSFLVRTVRAVYWRAPGEEDVTMVPLVRWEVLENPPLQILDYPDDDL